MIELVAVVIGTAILAVLEPTAEQRQRVRTRIRP